MESYEPNTHSFVVKVWLEETVAEAGRGSWRGHITHVVSGERRYMQSLGEITKFIESYLIGMGVQPEVERRMPWWLGRGRPRP
ncbi:MAG: hypothetical protein U0X20_23015 [Caldilineaceae bacterium]